MANPLSPTNGQGETLDYVIGDDGLARLKRSVGSRTPTGAASPSGNTAVVTHLAGGTIGATDEVVVIGAKDPSGKAQPLKEDTAGNLLTAASPVNYVAIPTGITLVQGAGTLAAATYFYRVSATSPSGETVPSVETSLAIAATTGVILSWPQVAGATGYKVYGRTTGAELLMATITNGTTLTFTDSGSVTPAGVMPTLNTALTSATGASLSASSLSVVLATDGVTIGIVTEAAPGTDTASSGLNGRLQRIAQRLTSILTGLPANTDNTLIASAALTTTQTGADQTNPTGKGLQVVLDMTVVGTGSVTLEIDGKDSVSGKYYALLVGTAVVTNVTNVYRVYPGLVAVANAVANDILPKTWRIKVTANNANSATYSVGASVIL